MVSGDERFDCFSVILNTDVKRVFQISEWVSIANCQGIPEDTQNGPQAEEQSQQQCQYDYRDHWHNTPHLLHNVAGTNVATFSHIL